MKKKYESSEDIFFDEIPNAWESNPFQMCMIILMIFGLIGIGVPIGNFAIVLVAIALPISCTLLGIRYGYDLRGSKE